MVQVRDTEAKAVVAVAPMAEARPQEVLLLRTIMAYNCSPSCPRINYWSSPLRTYGGQVMGTATRSDNARVLNNTRATISAFR